MIRRLASIVAVATLLAACSGGPVRRVSEPSASIQQLTARTDGRWDVALRLNNFSSVAMHFDAAALELAFDNGPAARLDVRPDLEVAPESADVHTVTVTPTPAGRARLATALADGRSLGYTLRGTIEATPQGSKPNTWTIKRESALSPVPGLPGALR